MKTLMTHARRRKVVKYLTLASLLLANIFSAHGSCRSDYDTQLYDAEAKMERARSETRNAVINIGYSYFIIPLAPIFLGIQGGFKIREKIKARKFAQASQITTLYHDIYSIDAGYPNHSFEFKKFHSDVQKKIKNPILSLNELKEKFIAYDQAALYCPGKTLTYKEIVKTTAKKIKKEIAR